MTKRLDWLDALRGGAALVVVVFHALGLVAPELLPWTASTFNPAHGAVAVFFLCSGWIIGASLQRDASLRRFWIGRFFRLYPLYWLTVGLVFLGLWGGLPVHQHNDPGTGFLLGLFRADLTPWTVFASFSMLHFYLGVWNLLGVFWTLNFELLFYVLASAAALCGLLRRPVVVALTVIAVAVVLEALGPHWGWRTVPFAQYSSLGLMFAGLALQRAPRARPLVATCATAMLAAIVVSGLWQHGDRSLIGWGTGTIGAVALMAWCAAHPSPQPWAWLVVAGKHCYSLYLLHAVVMLFVPRVGGAASTVLLWLALTFCAAALAHRWIERPAIALGRQLANPLHHNVRREVAERLDQQASA